MGTPDTVVQVSPEDGERVVEALERDDAKTIALTRRQNGERVVIRLAAVSSVVFRRIEPDPPRGRRMVTSTSFPAV